MDEALQESQQPTENEQTTLNPEEADQLSPV